MFPPIIELFIIAVMLGEDMTNSANLDELKQLECFPLKVIEAGSVKLRYG